MCPADRHQLILVLLREIDSLFPTAMALDGSAVAQSPKYKFVDNLLCASMRYERVFSLSFATLAVFLRWNHTFDSPLKEIWLSL
jgi:hypothetical protein